MFTWNTLTYPNTPGTFHLQAELFYYQDLQVCLQVCYLEMTFDFSISFDILCHFFSYTNLIMHINNFHRTLSSNACQGFSSFLWIKAAVVGYHWLFNQGNYLLLYSLIYLAHHTVMLICQFCILQMQSKYGCTKKESVSSLLFVYLCHIALCTSSATCYLRWIFS